MTKDDNRTPSFVAASLAVLMGTTALTSMSAPALAQDDEEMALEEVVVTGSRIVRRDFTASSPLVTVDSDAFDKISTIGVENALNQLPQFVPGTGTGGPGQGTQFGTTDVQGTPANSPGISTVNLRGIGTFRNLVLLDGRRAQPANAALVVDVNTIPSAAIDSVEVISGGASAVYGADAVSGVVNFKLKKDYQGLTLDAQTGITEEGDGNETRINGLIGGNFDDGRGNVMFGGEFAKRTKVKGVDRKWQRDFWQHPLRTGAGPSVSYISGLPGTPEVQAVVDNIFSEVPAGTVLAGGTSFYVNADGTLFIPDNDEFGAIGYTGPTDFPQYSVNENGEVIENETFGLLSSPMERYSMFGRADYEITDGINFFLQGNMTEVVVKQTLNYSPATSLWAATIPRDGRELPAELEQLLDARPDPTADWTLNRSLDFIGPRQSVNSSTVYQILAGFDGDLPFGDWTYEVYGSHGKTTNINQLYGFGSVERWRDVAAAPNFGEGYTVAGAGGTGISCTSGLPIFDDFEISEDCVNAISANMKNTTIIKQDIVEANLQGGILELPAGELRGAVGATYRKNSAAFEPDLLNDRESIIDQPIGLFAANNSAGHTTVKEVYGELLVPVLGDMPGIQNLNLEIGGRLSDYNLAGTIETYKVIGNWTVNDYVTFRGGYQLANRAPNVAELFTAATQSVVFLPGADPCQSNTTSPWGNVEGNPNRQQVIELCSQLNGGPNTDWEQSPLFPDYIGPFGYFPFEIAIIAGNQELNNEKARTWTAGTVLRSPIDSGIFSNITATVDWYSIKITDAIAPLAPEAPYQQCLNAFGTNPDFDINNEYCQLIVRNEVTGLRQQVFTNYFNSGLIKTSGIDFAVNWMFEAGPGNLNVTIQGNYLIEYKDQSIPGAPIFDSKGTFDDGGQFDYKTNTQVTYMMDGWAAGLRWRHLPSIKSAATVQNPNSTSEGAPSYNLFDFFGNIQLNDTVGLRGGIDNLLNKKPPLINADPGIGTAPTGTNPSYYDVLGRRFYAGLNLQF